MPRQKQYEEAEVIEKAMALFWRNGYESTSVRMLEKEMGINQFSIYASFGNKHGVFIESIKCYKLKLAPLIMKLRNSNEGVAGIKTYFYDFLAFSQESDVSKGCLVTNTFNEMGESPDPVVVEALQKFTLEIKELFASKLRQINSKTEKTVQREANYLLTAILGLSVASKGFSQDWLNDFIETTFKAI